MKCWNDIRKKNHALTIILELSLILLTVIICILHIFSLFTYKNHSDSTLTLKESTDTPIPYGSTFTDSGVSGVVAQESTPPTLHLSGAEELYIPLGGPLAEPGYFAIDNTDGNLTASVVISEIDLYTAGTYTLTYTVSDSSGNITSKKRIIHIFQPQSPEQTANPPGNIVYLTFDDGPGQYTQNLLDILDKYNVNATFFVTGQYKDYHYLIGESYKQGHTIALHTYSHKFSEIYASETAYYGDLSKISAICEAQTGEKPSIVRFPGGTSNTVSKKYCLGIMSSLIQSLTDHGYQYCDWNVDSKDAGEAQTASAVASNVIHDIQQFPSSIVLMHDTKAYSVEAVEEILYWGLTHGYTFLPLTAESPMWHHHAYN